MGGVSQQIINLQTELNYLDKVKIYSIVSHQNKEQIKDNACLPRAIVVALAHLNMKKNDGDDYYTKRYDTVRDSRKGLQGKLAHDPLRTSVGIGNRVGTLDDIKAYEDYLRVSINVISLSCNKKIIKGSDKYEDKIYLIHSPLSEC